MFGPAVRTNGIRQRDPALGGRHGQRRRGLRVRECRDRDRVGGAAGRPGRADGSRRDRCRPRSPGRRRRPPRFDRLDHRVAERIGLRAAAGEVTSIRPDGRFEGGDDLGRVADVTDRRRHVEDAVVADVGPRRDALQAGRLRMVGAAGAVVSALPAASRPRACRGTTPAGRPRAACGRRRRRPRRNGDDHLRRRPLRAALREAGRVRVPLRVEEAFASDRCRRRRRRSSSPRRAAARQQARPRRSGRGCG